MAFTDNKIIHCVTVSAGHQNMVKLAYFKTDSGGLEKGSNTVPLIQPDKSVCGSDVHHWLNPTG